MEYPNKRYSKIDQLLARHFKYNSASLSSPPPFLCSQIITPFSNSIISTNKETGLLFKPTVESVYPYSTGCSLSYGRLRVVQIKKMI